jgi:amidase
METNHDPVGALCTENALQLAGAQHGPLTGLTFVAKDVFDIAGVKTGFGHPAWLQSHDAPRSTASAVSNLLHAGADLIGKAHSDELCFSLSGENIHYGTPVNSAAPDRIPGGSSNGSAAAVAAQLCDFALGTDCGGSVRIPASYCGLLGLRPTWNRVPTDGVVDFAPSFDVAGWFARDGALMQRIGAVLLPNFIAEASAPQRLLIADDAFATLSEDVARALAPAVQAVSAQASNAEHVTVSADGLDPWFQAFRVIQGFEVWRSVGKWVTDTQPKLGPGVAERIAWSATVTPEMYAAACKTRNSVRERLGDLLAPDTLLCVPTSPRPAPLRNMPSDTVEVEYRAQAMRILCIAGLCGLPQITLPLASLQGLPLGVSLIGAPNADETLLALAARLCPAIQNGL